MEEEKKEEVPAEAPATLEISVNDVPKTGDKFGG